MPMDAAEQKAFDDLKASHAALDAENKKLKTPPADDEKAKKEKEEKERLEREGAGGLNEKVRKEQEEKAARDKDVGKMEASILFNVGIGKFVEENKDILPEECAALVKAAETERYESNTQKANAIKSAIIQSFFSLQAYVDMLTVSQKKSIDDYLKLTKNGREERADHVFENILEPQLQNVKRVKKAEDLNRGGFGNGTKVDNDYLERTMKNSRKHYLKGEK
jgi:hypothetical protein